MASSAHQYRVRARKAGVLERVKELARQMIADKAEVGEKIGWDKAFVEAAKYMGPEINFRLKQQGEPIDGAGAMAAVVGRKAVKKGSKRVVKVKAPEEFARGGDREADKEWVVSELRAASLGVAPKTAPPSELAWHLWERCASDDEFCKQMLKDAFKAAPKVEAVKAEVAAVVDQKTESLLELIRRIRKEIEGVVPQGDSGEPGLPRDGVGRG
jgi:hypothetical protein